MQKILFVCLGNICRSPGAQGMLEHLIQSQGLSDHYQVDSAATMNYHIGKPPDPRSVEAMHIAGIDISYQRARLFDTTDFLKFDHIWVMDQRNLDHVKSMQTPEVGKPPKLLMSFYPEHKLDYVPDPFHGGPEDFTAMVELLRTVCGKALVVLEKNRT